MVVIIQQLELKESITFANSKILIENPDFQHKRFLGEHETIYRRKSPHNIHNMDNTYIHSSHINPKTVE